MSDNLREQAYNAACEIIETAGLKKGQILVVGCSTSEILGSRIGTDSSPDTAKEVFDGIFKAAQEKEIFIAAQCCEHLNRAIITERAAVPYADIVNVVPQPKAGGSFATAAYATFSEPVALEEIRADAGLDIGFTMIGMHLKKVAVPVRLKNNRIGSATVLAARVRPKFIGGDRAHYDDNLK
ncbi:MAG: TIGR01440 family protein [Acutalibacteraceae bacterium]